MLNFCLGVLAAAVVYTFRPGWAAKPSAWLRSAWAKIKSAD